MDLNARIYIAGHQGMVGSAILRKMQDQGFKNFIVRTFNQLDLRDQLATTEFFKKEKPEYVILAAAKVGGIKANNDRKAEFIYDNLMIQNNVIHNAYLSGVKKLLFLGSACVYPKLAPQPLQEESLLSGYLEPTNEPYAIAKIAGIKMTDSYRDQYGCNFISAMPTNLYGINDNYDLDSSHVLPALIRKFHEAKKNKIHEVVIWGTGTPTREFMHADDVGDACVWLMNNYNEAGIINIGTGKEISIAELAELVKEIVDYKGRIVYDSTKPDGTPRRLMDISKLKECGWTARIELKDGIQSVYQTLSAEPWY